MATAESSPNKCTRSKNLQFARRLYGLKHFFGRWPTKNTIEYAVNYSILATAVDIRVNRHAWSCRFSPNYHGAISIEAPVLGCRIGGSVWFETGVTGSLRVL